MSFSTHCRPSCFWFSIALLVSLSFTSVGRWASIACLSWHWHWRRCGKRSSTKLACLLCMKSNLVSMCFLVYGSHSELAYSSMGLAKARYVFSLRCVQLISRLHLRNPCVLFSCAVMALIRLSPSLVAYQQQQQRDGLLAVRHNHQNQEWYAAYFLNWNDLQPRFKVEDKENCFMLNATNTFGPVKTCLAFQFLQTKSVFVCKIFVHSMKGLQ